jgi:N-acetylglucosaminyl-diphospho-decaprenol L-rhamnosyltransferase
VHDLAVIIVSTNEGHWLRPALASVFAHAGGASLDVIVADNESTDGTRELVEQEFPEARVVTCENRGFAHANNRGFMASQARYVLFLNPDTEILDGTFGDLVRALDARPNVGLIGVKQVTADGALFPTIRRFPNALRALGEALGSERFPFRASWLGERELDMDVYEREVECDWTSGSFMLARREALLSGGILDERFFIYGEEPDLCLRMKKAGWQIRHLPTMTILHHAGKAGVKPRMEAQNAYARMQHARKHFGRSHRVAYATALALRHVARMAPSGGPDAADRQSVGRSSLRGRCGGRCRFGRATRRERDLQSLNSDPRDDATLAGSVPRVSLPTSRRCGRAASHAHGAIPPGVGIRAGRRHRPRRSGRTVDAARRHPGE